MDIKNNILDEARFPCLNKNIKDWNNVAKNDYKNLYHATSKESIPSIMAQGLLTSACGKIHGSMEIRPKPKTIYLSKHETSNNLNTNLFDSTDDVIVLMISIDENLLASSYPDDGMFVAFGNEDLWETEEDIAEELSIPLSEAEDLMKIFASATNDKLAEIMKPLMSWYLINHGEISTPFDIPPGKIISAHRLSDFSNFVLPRMETQTGHHSVEDCAQNYI